MSEVSNPAECAEPAVCPLCERSDRTEMVGAPSPDNWWCHRCTGWLTYLAGAAALRRLEKGGPNV